jgi:hypothetical protein
MDLVDEYSSLPAVMQAMGEAFASAFGIDKPGEKEEAKNE